MKFDVGDKNRCHLVCVCVKFHLNRCRFAAAVAKCLGGSLLLGHSVNIFFQMKYWPAEAILSNSTWKLLWFEITKMMIAV